MPEILPLSELRRRRADALPSPDWWQISRMTGECFKTLHYCGGDT
jgi:hypothetical protein